MSRGKKVTSGIDFAGYGPDEDRDQLIEMGLRLTPLERLRWLEQTVEELRPWVGKAAEAERKDRG